MNSLRRLCATIALVMTLTTGVGCQYARTYVSTLGRGRIIKGEEPAENVEPASLQDDTPTAIEQVDAIERRNAGTVEPAAASSSPWSRFIGRFKPAKRIPLPLTKSVEDDDAKPADDDSDAIDLDEF